MRNVKIYLLISMILCIVKADAQSLTLQVASQVPEGSKFSLTLQMSNFEADPPQSISLPNCTLLYGPSISHGTQMTSINGNTTVTTYLNASYTFRADKESTVQIPAFTLTAKDGKKYSTKPTKLTIGPAGQRPTRNPYSSPMQPDGGLVDAKDHFKADDMFVRISVDRNNVYEQEPVIATIKLYTLQSIRAFQMVSQPTFEGFLSEELDVSDSQGIETVNGKEYTTVILKRCILFPQKTGHLSLSSGTYDVTLVARVNVNSGSFIPDFRLVEKQVKTTENVAKINVRELPQPQPIGFNGAVGDFTASTDLSSLALRTDEPATFTFTVKGTGNIKYLKTPNLDMPPGIDVYTPKTDIDATYSHGNISGTFTVNYTIVPQEVGTFDIPPLHFSYFDVNTKQYKTLDLGGYTVKVAKGLNSGITEQRSIAKGMTDILHIKTGDHGLSHNVSYVYNTFGYWLLYIILTFGFIVVLVIYRRQVRLNADVRGRQLARALRKAMKRFKNARSAMAAHQSDKFYADINQALWGYLGDKLGIPASQLVRDNIASQLADYGVDQSGIDNIINILDECEMARFTPMHSDADMADIYDKVVNAVRSIENVKKSRNA